MDISGGATGKSGLNLGKFKQPGELEATNSDYIMYKFISVCVSEFVKVSRFVKVCVCGK